RIFGSEPNRGDIVVFRLPKDDSTDYIKRVIGLPGDRIQMREGLLYINEKPVKRERLSDFIGEDPCGSDATARVKRWKETLPNGVTYESLDCVDNGFYDNTNVYTVPTGHFFMMGDNRDNSTDSRVLSQVGYVPFENIVGRAQIIFFSVREGEHAWMVWRWPWAVRWNRLFTIVRCAAGEQANRLPSRRPSQSPTASRPVQPLPLKLQSPRSAVAAIRPPSSNASATVSRITRCSNK